MNRLDEEISPLDYKVRHSNLTKAKAATSGVLCKKVLEISQNLQENTCARVSFLKKRLWHRSLLLKKRLWHRCFPVNFVKFLKAPFLQNTSGRLLLQTVKEVDKGSAVVVWDRDVYVRDKKPTRR